MKYVVMFILGFISHKVVNYTYDVSFLREFTSEVCSKQYKLDVENPEIDVPLTKRFECTQEQMGIVDNLKYLLLRPGVYPSQDDWTF